MLCVFSTPKAESSRVFGVTSDKNASLPKSDEMIKILPAFAQSRILHYRFTLEEEVWITVFATERLDEFILD